MGSAANTLGMGVQKSASRIAAPMIGGMITAPLLSLFIIPAACKLMWLSRHRGKRNNSPPRLRRSGGGYSGAILLAGVNVPMNPEHGMLFPAAAHRRGQRPAAYPLAMWFYFEQPSDAWLIYGADKLAARKRRRGAETTLLVLSPAGGWPGAILGQRCFRHKTQKQPFRTRFHQRSAQRGGAGRAVRGLCPSAQPLSG